MSRPDGHSAGPGSKTNQPVRLRFTAPGGEPRAQTPILTSTAFLGLRAGRAEALPAAAGIHRCRGLRRAGRRGNARFCRFLRLSPRPENGVNRKTQGSKGDPRNGNRSEPAARCMRPGGMRPGWEKPHKSQKGITCASWLRRNWRPSVGRCLFEVVAQMVGGAPAKTGRAPSPNRGEMVRCSKPETTPGGGR
jgi:hypothetical protein